MTSVDIALSTVIRSASPFAAMFLRASAAMCTFASIAVTWRAPSRAAIIASSPEPVPISSTCAAGEMTRASAC